MPRRASRPSAQPRRANSAGARGAGRRRSPARRSTSHHRQPVGSSGKRPDAQLPDHLLDIVAAHQQVEPEISASSATRMLRAREGVRAVLLQMNLDRYFHAFLRDGWDDLRSLYEMTDADLARFGMRRTHRLRLLAGIAERRMLAEAAEQRQTQEARQPRLVPPPPEVRRDTSPPPPVQSS
eukprot:TRINITY_DN41048_c0_g1_i1.p3 TRINITY_DN41048_c0_g1~~TRINITY_DN41048_c0_g1_i1.p3  ORF type:complete len:181 (+),score=52.82 TRINITY_DN41048_c0_g1_i1:46-588(+)